MMGKSRKHLGNTHQLGGSSHLPLPVSLLCFRLTKAIFLLPLLALAVAVEVEALIDLKIQLSS